MTRKETQNVLFMFLAFLIGVAIIFLFDPIQYMPLPAERTDIARLGVPIHDYDALLERIKKDIHREELDVKIAVGPYFKYLGTQGQLMKTGPYSYLIVIDRDFGSQLSTEEKTALIAHETGHIVFPPSFMDKISLGKITDNQVLADTFAAKYVDPKHLITLLDKLYSDYRVRIENAEKLTKDH